MRSVDGILLRLTASHTLFQATVRLTRALSTLPAISPVLNALHELWLTLTLSLLRKLPDVQRVYLRGSYVRGTHRPYWSDIDLAVLLSDEVSGYQKEKRFMQRFRLIQRLNPCIRDYWHWVLTEEELKVGQRYWTALLLQEWSEKKGAALPSFSLGSVSGRFFLASSINRYFLWKEDLERRLALGPIPFPIRLSLEKKKLFFATLVEQLKGTQSVLSAEEALILIRKARQASDEFHIDIDKATDCLPFEKNAFLFEQSGFETLFDRCHLRLCLGLKNEEALLKEYFFRILQRWFVLSKKASPPDRRTLCLLAEKELDQIPLPRVLLQSALSERSAQLEPVHWFHLGMELAKFNTSLI